MEAKVWIRKRKLASGKTSHHLRWICPTEHRWKSRHVGTDRKRADREAALLEVDLNEGTYTASRKITWEAFVEDHVAKIDGKLHAGETRQILTEFGRVTQVSGPMAVTYPMTERWVAELQAKGLAPSTVNKHITYLSTAMNRAVKRGFAGKNPVDNDLRKVVEKKELRILTAVEEPKLLELANTLFGEHMETFVRFVLETWGRLSEVMGLAWEDVHFEDESLHFRSTKSHEDRFIPLDPGTGILTRLRRLQVKTMQDGGPFVGIGSKVKVGRRWRRIIADAGIPHIVIHDLRRTGISRALLAGMPAVAVMKLAGHRSINTTMRYYAQVNERDLREAVVKMNKNAG